MINENGIKTAGALSMKSIHCKVPTMGMQVFEASQADNCGFATVRVRWSPPRNKFVC